MKYKSLFSLFLLSLFQTPTQAQSLKGDMNDDGRLTIEDVTLLVREVLKTPVPDSSAHEYVNLGLPSGTLWATCNLGAQSPEKYGDYYAWAELVPKEVYSWSRYVWIKAGRSDWKGCNKYTVPDGLMVGVWYSDDIFVGDNLTKLLPEDDAARMTWGEGWSIPTAEQFNELINYSTCTSDNLNGSRVYKIVGPNKNCIYLPYAGYYNVQQAAEIGLTMNYWTSSLDTKDSSNALMFGPSVRAAARNQGLTIRPVRSGK